MHIFYKKTLAFLIFSFVIQSKLAAQYNSDFIAHLSHQNLKKEHNIYLKQLHTEQDSSFYYEAKYFLQYKEDSLFFNSFDKSRELFLKDSSAVNFASQYFITKPEKVRSYWFDSLLLKSSAQYSSRIEKFYRYSLNPLEIANDSIPIVFREDFIKYKKAFKKKALVSAGLSTLVPGLGKLYIGNRRSFVASITSISLFVLQGIESYNKKGVYHPLTILDAGFFSCFYAVNIYGSYSETKNKKLELRNQYLIDVSNYFYKYSTQLYK